jgi:diadenosine tetraphosphate (Ap4A) HIT family hydrolase
MVRRKLSKSLSGQFERRPMDWESLRQGLAGRCFICELVRGTAGFEHHVIHEDAETIVFLNKYPTLLGYALVAPKAHREGVTAEFTEAEYLHLQRVVYRVSEAVRAALPTERMYICSLGSRDGNSHVHWHVAPLPPGVPFERQQFQGPRQRRDPRHERGGLRVVS